ncbi:hypothetical protein LWI29_013013 [Acer saccharum]|uniref:Uncharacterized protein n=1 Tax=Acer saccharum TaxID=4024 RepID=A0AA39SDE3_ACESA|nr:hypothetical protein LWI29_013013 [Acer saccharum]
MVQSRVEKSSFGHFPSCDKTGFSREEGMIIHGEGKVCFRVADYSSKAAKGKDKMVYAKKPTGRPQPKATKGGTIILEKRRVGEKELVSSDIDSYSSSEKGFFRGTHVQNQEIGPIVFLDIRSSRELGQDFIEERFLVQDPGSKKGFEDSLQKENLELNSETGEEGDISGSQPSALEMGVTGQGNGNMRSIRKKSSTTNTHGMRTRLARRREQSQPILQDNDIDVVDVEGNQFSWSLEEEISKVIETRVAIGAI